MFGFFQDSSTRGYPLISQSTDVKGKELSGRIPGHGPIDPQVEEHFQIQKTFVCEQGEDKPSR